MTSYLWKFWGIRISPALTTTSKGSVEVFDWLLLVYNELVRKYMLYEHHCKQAKQGKHAQGSSSKSSRDGPAHPVFYSSWLPDTC